MRRGIVPGAAVAVLASVLFASSSGATSEVSEKSCRGFTDAGRESHRLIFNVRCEFELGRIVVEPSSQVWGVWRKTELHGDVKEGDVVVCKQGPNRASARCRGNASRGVRVRGQLEAKDVTFDCEFVTTIKVFSRRGGTPLTDEIGPRPARNCENIPDF